MNTRETRVAGIINALVNPLLMCSFLPIIEGKAALDMSSPTGFLGAACARCRHRRGGEFATAVWKGRWGLG